MTTYTQLPINHHSFSFPAIFCGTEALVAVVRNGGCYGVHLNGEFVAQLKLNEDIHHWVIDRGELFDYDLIEEIGHRIENMLS